LAIPVCQNFLVVLGASGTSQAAPHVSAVASLVIEDIGRRPGRVKTILQQSADDLGKKGNDPFYGKGRLNAAAATGN
jgi:subtilisin family serine protease